MKRIVVIGGGKGQSALLRGLKTIPHTHLSAIVTVADDGGSTGRLREDFDMPAMGDVRNVLLALAESESILRDMINFRFKEDSMSELAGHSLGNLILTALTETTGDFTQAIASMSQFLNVEGDIIPVAPVGMTLVAEMKDGTIVRGESNIPEYRNSIRRVYYEDEVFANQKAIDAIENADIVIFGVGSLYTSILPNVIIPGIKKALKNTKANFIYYCNVMTESGETTNFSLEDHVKAIEAHSGIEIDVVVKPSDEIPDEVLKVYELENSTLIEIENNVHNFTLIEQNLLNFNENRVSHDHDLVALGFSEVWEAVLCLLAAK